MKHTSYTSQPTALYPLWLSVWNYGPEVVGTLSVAFVMALIAKKVQKIRSKQRDQILSWKQKGQDDQSLVFYSVDDFWSVDNPYSSLLQDSDENRRKQAPLLIRMYDAITEGTKRLDELEVLIGAESLISDIERLRYTYEGEELELQIQKRYIETNIILKELRLHPIPVPKKRFGSSESHISPPSNPPE